MAERKSFSVGVPDGVHAHRRDAENKIARLCFNRPSRRDVYRPKLYEFIWSQIMLSTDEDIRRFFGKAE